MRIKKHENLTQANITKVISLLEPKEGKPITKKEACAILNIAYNTTRLQKIIDEHKEMVEFRARRKAQNKGKAATPDEIKAVVRSYIDGANVSEIAGDLYRSPAFVKAIIERLGIPQKLADSDYEGMRNAMVPEQCVRESFEIGERVWFAKRNKMAEVLEEHKNIDYEAKYGCKCYKLWVLDPCDLSNTFFPWMNGDRAGFYGSALAYDLGSLRHIQEYLD